MEAQKSGGQRRRRKTDAGQMLRELEGLCDSLQPGDMIPTHTELMRRFDASERAVLGALDELRREGRIVRRRRAGTFVAERKLPIAGGGVTGPSTIADNRTVVALVGLAEPDRAIFDRAVSLLFGHVAAAGLSLVCESANVDSGALRGALPLPISERPVGYVVFGRRLLPVAKQLQDAGQRVVSVGTPYAYTMPEVPVVQGDQEHGGYLATGHLLELGHRRIAFRGWSDWPQMQRWHGHQKALSEARQQGIDVRDSEIFEGEYRQWRDDPETAEAYFRRPEAPTGIVVWNDHMAVALLTLLSYIGIRVPQDVSLVGYDNVPEGQQVHPSLTTVESALDQQLQAAIRLLTQPVAPPPTTTVVVLPTLISRESSASAPKI